jgi:hypothetical protein
MSAINVFNLNHMISINKISTPTGLSVKTLSSTIQVHFLITAILVVIGQGTGDIWTELVWCCLMFLQISQLKYYISLLAHHVNYKDCLAYFVNADHVV